MTCSFEKVTPTLHNHPPLCHMHIVLASPGWDAASILNYSMHMVSVMWNGHLISIKVKRWGVQSAANTETAGLSVLSLKGKPLSRQKQCWAIIAWCRINNSFSVISKSYKTVNLFKHSIQIICKRDKKKKSQSCMKDPKVQRKQWEHCALIKTSLGQVLSWNCIRLSINQLELWVFFRDLYAWSAWKE